MSEDETKQGYEMGDTYIRGFGGFRKDGTAFMQECEPILYRTKEMNNNYVDGSTPEEREAYSEIETE